MKPFKIDFLTTTQYPYIDEPMIWQYDAFEININPPTNYGIYPINPFPSGDWADTAYRSPYIYRTLDSLRLLLAGLKLRPAP